MNTNKFYERTKLFNEIIYEINKVETNYCTELNKLNIHLSQLIENHKQAINQRLITDDSKKIAKSKTMKTEENKEKEFKKHSLKEPKLKEIKENLILHKEENPMIDKLISEGLLNLLIFYKNKHKLISTQVSKLGVILYQFASTQKKYDPDDLIKIENCEKEFEINFLKLMKVKKTYFKKMCELELHLHMTEKDKERRDCQCHYRTE